MGQQPIDPRIFELYDEYCHGAMDRREYFRRAAKITVGGVAATGMAQALIPNYAHGHTVDFTDERIKATYVTYPSPGGNSGEMRGYLVQPAGEGPFPAVLVIHENRGLNPYVEDTARAAAVAGFVALAPDGLAPVGGYPGNDDDGRTMQRALDQPKLRIDFLNSAKFLKDHSLSTGKMGAVGFCWGGGTVNYLAVEMGSDLLAGVPYYGRSAPSEDVPRIQAPLLIQSASDDPRINDMWPEFEAALKTHNKQYERVVYPDTRHGFHNYSTGRYNKEMAEKSWASSIAFFQTHLS
ncbi:MAG: dienelactone hydrolase family protein [Alphaproteobacteria bacterium]|nr:dienelactone hydrolase family protein [Alphaproteobacteria bacterium]